MKFSKILIIVGLVCVAGLLLVFGVKLQAQNRPDRDAIMANLGEMNADMSSRMAQFRNRQQGSNWGGQQSSNNEDSKNNPDYYRTIVDNNIFRPLGWRPPNKEPEYKFIGTSVNDKNSAKLEAYVKERRSGKSYFVTIGDKVGDTVVKEISEKEIILDKDGENITLRGGNMQFLSSGNSSRSSSRSDDRDESANNSSRSNNREASAKAKASEEAKRRAEEAMRRAQEMRNRFMNASRGERERMMREFRSRGGFRGRR